MNTYEENTLKQFYQEFEIEAKYYFKSSAGDWTRGTKHAFETECDEVKWKVIYPSITGEVTLELIAMNSKYFPITFTDEEDAASIKTNILSSCLWALTQKDLQDIIKEKVQKIFTKQEGIK